VTSPDQSPRPLKAVVLDVDGTLYRQGPLRRAMLVRLLSAHALRPAAAWRTFLSLRAYRRAQEQLRGRDHDDMAGAQLRLACERSRLDQATIAACVERWMEREPLSLLGRYLQPGLVEFLEACRARGLRLATLSDYPAEAKLQALGLSGYFDANLCAQAREIGAFKPSPRGLHVALGRLGVAPGEAVYVGDRADVDAPAAHAAGVACAILTDGTAPAITNPYFAAASYFHLRDFLFR
jgi:HAD superfamily hydrolase (TIGR01509 family)